MTTRFLVVTVTLALCLSRAAAGQSCTPKKELEKYLLRSSVAKGTTVLAFDHSGQDWQALAWDGSSVNPLTESFFVDRKPVPPEARLSVGSGDSLAVVAFNTNPMLYAVQVKPTTEVDIESLAQFKQLARLLGGLVQSALGLSTFSQVQPPPPPPPEAAEDIEAVDLPPDPDSIFLSLQNILGTKAADVRVQLTALDAAQKRIRNLADRLESNTFASREYMRAVESGGAVRQTLAKLPDVETLDASIDRAASDLARIQADLPASTCVASYTAASGAISRKVRGFPTQGREAEEIAFQRNLQLLDNENTRLDSCTDDEGEVLAKLRDWLEANPPQNSPLTGDNLSTLQGIRLTIDQYLNLVAGLEQLKAASAGLLAKTPAAGKAAQELRLLAQREAESIDPSEAKAKEAVLCSLSFGVLAVSPADDPQVDPLKIQQRSFAIKAQAPFAADVVHRRADLEPKFEVDSEKAASFSLGFGVLYTQQVNPVWSAVADPRVEDPTDDTQKYIARTDEEKIAGTVALIASYIPKQKSRRVRFGFDIGAGLDDDHPTGLLGVSVSLGKFARLGVGVGWPLVDELKDGQSELSLDENGAVDPANLTPVGSSDDIRKREHYDETAYFSLTFSLNSLPFFEPEDE